MLYEGWEAMRADLSGAVLILVLLENALRAVLHGADLHGADLRLNPCFVGKCSTRCATTAIEHGSHTTS